MPRGCRLQVRATSQRNYLLYHSVTNAPAHIISLHPQYPEETAELQTRRLLGHISSRASTENPPSLYPREKKDSFENAMSVTQESSQNGCKRETCDETKKEQWTICVRTVKAWAKKQNRVWANTSDHPLWETWWHRWYLCLNRIVTLPRRHITVCSFGQQHSMTRSSVILT